MSSEKPDRSAELFLNGKQRITSFADGNVVLSGSLQRSLRPHTLLSTTKRGGRESENATPNLPEVPRAHLALDWALDPVSFSSLRKTSSPKQISPVKTTL